MTTSRPWYDLPADLAIALRPELEATAEEIIEALREGVPDYRRPLEGSFGRGLRRGVFSALDHFLQEVEAGGPVPRRRDLYVSIGRGEHRAGRSLDALLGAYRLGARVAWRRQAEVAVAVGTDQAVLVTFAESIFAYIDELSAESAEGYALEQTATAGLAQLRRRRLVRLLLHEPPAEPDAVEVAAADARWPLPRALAALVVTGPAREDAIARLGADVATDASDEETLVALVPDPDGPGRRAAVEAAVGARSGDDESLAALGPSVAWTDAPLSLARARAALELARTGAVEAGRLVVAAEHGAALLLTSDPRLVSELVRDRLAPLDALGPGPRRRLAETLEAWLAEQGRPQAVAGRLGVHPQTVRYRLGRLREAFGDTLDDPDARFELDLALRTRAFLGNATG